MNGFQRKTIDRAMANDDKLSTWECEFIESLDDKTDGYDLSEAQNHILNRIGEKV